jgi:hypothetical protein
MSERTPHVAWCHGATKAKAEDNAEAQSTLSCRRGTPHPPVSRTSIRDARYTPTPVFCKKRLQADENKGREPEKESKENLRGSTSLRERNLRQEHRNSAGELAVAAKTHWVAEERRDETWTLSA